MTRFVSLSLPLALLLACAVNAAAQEQKAAPAAANQTSEPADVLTNKDVLDMLKAGLSPEVITAKIKISATKFDTSVAALQELKAAGASEAVMLAVVESSSRAANPSKSSDASPPPSAPVSTEPSGPASADGSKATVYVFRHKNFSSRNMQPSVYVDGEEVARMDDGKYFAIRLTPGKHSVEVNKGHSGAQIDMKAGEEYYFRIDYTTGFLKSRSKIDFLQKEQGALEIKKMKPLEDKWIKDRTRVVAASAAQAN
jgi:hypothetical protein